MDSSSSSSLVVDILYRLDKLHVAASVYGMVLRDQYCTIRYYCFALYICTYITFIDFFWFIYLYFFFVERDRERERTLAMTNVNRKNLICLESIFLDYLQVWFGFFFLFLIRYEIIRTKT